MTEATGQTIPLRTRLAMYGSGLFADGATNVVIPLWALYLQPSPLAFGIVIGARSFLPFLLSIHGGVLMDRFGARQVMIFFGAIGLVVPVLFPLLPWIWMAGLLNLLIGLTSTMNWVGVQTLVGQIGRGNPALTWRVTFCNRLGFLVSPVLAGAVWDWLGPWGGFGVTLVWAVLFMIAASQLPRAQAAQGTGKNAVGEGGAENSEPAFRLRDMLPRYADYAHAFSLLGIPLVAVVAAGSVLNIAVGGIQGSFFIAYMKEIGLTGTMIGMIFAGINMAGLVGTASVMTVSRWLGDVRFLNMTVVAALAAITVTPLLGTFAALLAVCVCRGYMQGSGQPLMIMIPAKVVPPGAQGAAVGLRISLNRFVQAFLPPIMGAVVGLVGLEQSFYWVGGSLLALTCALWIIFRPPNRT